MTPTKDASRLDYLSNRPFLVINAILRPAAHVRTERKGWKKNNDNLQLFEQPVIKNHISTNTIKGALVIIDIMAIEVVKCPFGHDSDELLMHYTKKYDALVQQARNIHIAKQAAVA